MYGNNLPQPLARRITCTCTSEVLAGYNPDSDHAAAQTLHDSVEKGST